MFGLVLIAFSFIILLIVSKDFRSIVALVIIAIWLAHYVFHYI